MVTKISSVQFKADKKLKTYIEEKTEKLSSLFDDILTCDIVLRLEKDDSENNKVIEIKVLVKNQSVFSRKQAKTFEEATDTALEALKKQLSKVKEKKNNRK